jgi:hypothetical protein
LGAIQKPEAQASKAAQQNNAGAEDDGGDRLTIRRSQENARTHKHRLPLRRAKLAAGGH